jgi:catechol 2,3-dioxygenase-like lactoylglutathione lyase family enzyme
MLTGSKATAMLPVVDMKRARKFYEETLKLKAGGPPRQAPEGEAHYDAGGTDIALYPRQTPTKADHTALTFEVQNLEGEMKELRGRGVRFEDYDMPGLKTTGGVATIGDERAAWFRDPEGNILCLHQGTTH